MFSHLLLLFNPSQRGPPAHTSDDHAPWASHSVGMGEEWPPKEGILPRRGQLYHIKKPARRFSKLKVHGFSKQGVWGFYEVNWSEISIQLKCPILNLTQSQKPVQHTRAPGLWSHSELEHLLFHFSVQLQVHLPRSQCIGYFSLTPTNTNS